MPEPVVKLTQGIHVMHLFYRIDRAFWAEITPGESENTRKRVEAVLAAYSQPSHPNIRSYANIGNKADLAFFLLSADLGELGRMHRELEACFPGGMLVPEFSYLSVTELPDYVSTDDDLKAMLARESVVPGHPQFEERFAAAQKRNLEYQHYRLYPELDDWEVMCFYPMSKKRNLQDNWYSLDFDVRKKLMAGHARTGRKYAGRISQLITGSTGLDDWEWGVTLMAHQVDAVKEIIYEMRFDEVTARFGDFGPFYINLRLSPADLWEHLKL